ncbi:MAG: hypothetical protein RJA98_3769 [Pseudomonadota bacterium]|jgi:hypothetical protein
MNTARQQPVFSAAATPTLHGASRSPQHPALSAGETRAVAQAPVLQRAATGRQLRLF